MGEWSYRRKDRRVSRVLQSSFLPGQELARKEDYAANGVLDLLRMYSSPQLRYLTARL